MSFESPSPALPFWLLCALLGVLWRPPEGFLSPLPVTAALFCLPRGSPPPKKMTFLLHTAPWPHPALSPRLPKTYLCTRTAQACRWHTGADKALMTYCATLFCPRAPRAVLFRVGVKTPASKTFSPSPRAPCEDGARTRTPYTQRVRICSVNIVTRGRDACRGLKPCSRAVICVGGSVVLFSRPRAARRCRQGDSAAMAL